MLFKYYLAWHNSCFFPLTFLISFLIKKSGDQHMNINTITSAYTNQTYANERTATIERNFSHAQEKTTSALAVDSVSISDEAKQAAKNEKSQHALSERAFEMLKIRRLSDKDIHAFENLLAESENYDSPKEYMKSLSAEKRDLLKRANSYGIDLSNEHIDSMTDEGAHNMFVEPNSRTYVDFNNDGVVDHGAARSFVFPPPNAPTEVKDAWDKTISELPEDKRLLASSIFMVQSLQANVKFDAAGNAVGFYAPGEAGYKNIFSQNVEDWDTLLDKTDQYLDFSESITNELHKLENIEEDRAIIASFRKHLKHQ